jgi:hypothetical protein
MAGISAVRIVDCAANLFVETFEVGDVRVVVMCERSTILLRVRKIVSMGSRLAALLFAGLMLVMPPSAAAKTLPQFDRTRAAPEDRVAVLVDGASAYRSPLVFYLVRTSVASEIRLRSDPRLIRIAVLRGSAHGLIPSTFWFRVPYLATGDYTISMWFVGTATGKWANWTPWTLLGRSSPGLKLVLHIRRQ